MTVTPLFKKLNFKQRKEILIINSPTEFEAELNAIKDCTVVKTDIKSLDEIEFILTFVNTQDEINALTPLIDKKLKGDGIVWFAYPKKTSKNYKSEINRDKGWNTLRQSGFETVRQVAIDDDWSALRFRKIEFIKSMSRKTTLQ